MRVVEKWLDNGWEKNSFGVTQRDKRTKGKIVQLGDFFFKKKDKPAPEPGASK